MQEHLYRAQRQNQKLKCSMRLPLYRRNSVGPPPVFLRIRETMITNIRRKVACTCNTYTVRVGLNGDATLQFAGVLLHHHAFVTRSLTRMPRLSQSYYVPGPDAEYVAVIFIITVYHVFPNRRCQSRYTFVSWTLRRPIIPGF